MTLLYPTSFATLGAWARDAGIPLHEARLRLAQYAVLQAIALDARLRAILVFKGGNALDFIWQPNRSTTDLDFSAELLGSGMHLQADTLRDLLGAAVRSVPTSTGVRLRLQHFRQNPRGTDKTFITYDITVGYALDGQQRLVLAMIEGQPVPQVVPVEVSLNDVVCASEVVRLQDRFPLRVSTIEDIVAEKLRALLQQVVRHRHRRQDLLDIAVAVRTQAQLDPERIAAFLLEKARGRGIVVSREAFHDPAVAEQARVDYEALSETTRTAFIPFDEALAVLHQFVDGLPIPQG